MRPREEPLPLEDYALLGDARTAALVGRDGSIDWLCFPRFDSPACFAALLGTPEHGRWLIAPVEDEVQVTRAYRDETLVLDTVFTTPSGTVRVVDFMPHHGDERADVVRLVEGVRGTVRVRMELVIRFDYGRIVPWMRRTDHALLAVGGPDALVLRSPVDTKGEGFSTVAEFDVAAGQRVPFDLSWHPSHLPPPDPLDVERALHDTAAGWHDWAVASAYEGAWSAPVLHSLVVLKALIHEPTGGIVAAPTTSLPETPGGARNWDYRFCWLRDATFTLAALVSGGYRDEARAWRDWLVRAIAGRPEDLQIMYGSAGERRLTELVLPWLPGYRGATPVRIGNAAVDQFQIDVYGEVMDALDLGRRNGMEPQEHAWWIQRVLMEHLEGCWDEPDEGLWEVRGGRRQFTHSKVMAWVAFDRAVRGVEAWGLPGPVERWRALRDEIHEEVCGKGYDADRGTFTQTFGRPELDASLLMIPLVGFLPAHDERVQGTIRAVQEELSEGPYVWRYRPDVEVEGVAGEEGAFLLCSFWLCQALALTGHRDEARGIFEQLVDTANDVGLLPEQYDPTGRRFLGNFPQAFSHTGLVNAAIALGGEGSRRPAPVTA